MRPKMSSSVVALAMESGWMMEESIWDAAPSHRFLAAAISLSPATPLNTTISVDGRCFSA